jgi:hypothetical protein
VCVRIFAKHEIGSASSSISWASARCTMSSPTGSEHNVEEAAGAGLDTQELAPPFVPGWQAAYSGIQQAPKPRGLSRTQKKTVKAQEKARQRALDKVLSEDAAGSQRQIQAAAEQARLLSSKKRKLFLAVAVAGLGLLCMLLWPIKSQGPPDGGGAGSGAGHVGFTGVSCVAGTSRILSVKFQCLAMFPPVEVLD